MPRGVPSVGRLRRRITTCIATSAIPLDTSSKTVMFSNEEYDDKLMMGEKSGGTTEMCYYVRLNGDVMRLIKY